ncbi:MAG: ATP-binding protein [Acidobacteria bacterium]|nr:ATP-binding protein [Acidobacteriota bacterium]
MLYGRERELARLLRNVSGGTHTLLHGVPGAGKTAILQQARTLVPPGPPHVVYVGDCSSRGALLRGALEERSDGFPAGEGLRVEELRNAFFRACRRERLCLFLDHLPAKPHYRLRRLLELLEPRCTLVCAVTADPGACDLCYWKFEALAVGAPSGGSARTWVDEELRRLGYALPLRESVGREIVRITARNPGAIARVLAVIGGQAFLLTDPIQVRRIFVDSLDAQAGA